jgi:predicted small lipoprotein YifL
LFINRGDLKANKFLFAMATYQSQSVDDMKYKLFALLATLFTMVACGQDKKEAAPEGDADSATTTATATSKVGKSISPVVQKFGEKKYAATTIAGNPDYYIMYFTASW